jgi:hypothetical protein
LEIERSRRVPNQGNTVSGDDSHFYFARNCWVRTEM